MHYLWVAGHDPLSAVLTRWGTGSYLTLINLNPGSTKGAGLGEELYSQFLAFLSGGQNSMGLAWLAFEP